ncbi:hypothetical protein CALCODRAFT_472331 [Calocera cornea HHB12733]|uniref:Uncharacterized protein n=1 Tax=Calocera cornea HHB12733 TaxID=1353952 RepID=A0A165ERJ4_9BASI|nr:hypothetical protein CALCODRAFT_472331 [Calocera cornea HHB12733]
MADPAPVPSGVQVPGNAVDGRDGPIVQMRKFEPRDLKEVRLLLGYSIMEQLAAANTLLYTNPFVIVAWLALSSVMIGLMDWWPDPSGPAWTWLMPLPALASCAVPFLFAIDWLNRAYFEDLTRRVLAQEDTVDIPAYYSRAPGSGFWVLIYKGNPIGLVAKDAKGKKGKDGKKDDGKKLDHSRIAHPPAPTAPTVALVRHFHLDAPYRPTFIQNDLLAHGLSQAFAAAPSLETAYFRVSKLTPWLEEVSKTMGMRRRAGPTGEELAKDVGRRGLMGWREWYVGVGREKWEERYEEMREMHGL